MWTAGEHRGHHRRRPADTGVTDGACEIAGNRVLFLFNNFEKVN